MEIFAHPAICTSPELVWALQERLGLRAVVEGRRVRMISTTRPTRPTDRPTPPPPTPTGGRPRLGIIRGRP